MNVHITQLVSLVGGSKFLNFGDFDTSAFGHPRNYTYEILKRKQNGHNKEPSVANEAYVRTAAVHLIPVLYNYLPASSEQISKQDRNAIVRLY